MEARKISEFELEVTHEIIVEPKIIKKVCEREFIEKQIKEIQAQKDDYDAKRDAEIAECQEILNEMDRLGIIVKPDIELAGEEVI